MNTKHYAVDTYVIRLIIQSHQIGGQLRFVIKPVLTIKLIPETSSNGIQHLAFGEKIMMILFLAFIIGLVVFSTFPYQEF